MIDALIGPYSNQNERDSWRALLQSGDIDSRVVDIEVPHKSSASSMSGVGGLALDKGTPLGIVDDINKVMAKSGFSKKIDKKKMTVAEAKPIIEENEAEKLLEDYDVIKEAIKSTEESGIVFIDEIDKLVNNGDYRGADASSEGVQRDLLPLIEGSTISTKHGNVNTDFILFICSGAFHSVKPADLLAELQGRLPIRVALKGLSEDDLYRILTEPVTNLIQQQIELLKSENVKLIFTEKAIRLIAKVAYEVSGML